ncbi:protein kinase domain-containing protein [Streptomyces sp. T028]|uniref:protein kinase domain-containing protein n=1 Tax=Streptomyces sp. T028 TaxID=3394379 RepID=UPI003A899726
MGEVWECTDLRLKRQVALKFIRPELLGSDDERQRVIRRFRREAAALAGVDHPHVATVHDAGEWKATQYLVMQLVPGVATVADLVAEHGPLTVKAAAAAGAQIAAGLSAVHAAGLVHRDLRPQNIMVAPGGILKVGHHAVAASSGAVAAVGESHDGIEYLTHVVADPVGGLGRCRARPHRLAGRRFPGYRHCSTPPDDRVPPVLD